MPKALGTGLAELSQRERGSLFITLLAAYTTLLHRLTGQTDIALCSPIESRGRAEVENLIGYFNNLVVMRCDLSGDPSFRDLVGRIREVCLEGYEHHEAPFERIVRSLQLERDPTRHPLFEAMLNYDRRTDGP